MSNYSFKNLEEDFVKNAGLIKPALSFIQKIMGANVKKFSTGKNQTEFSNALILVMDIAIPEDMAKFLAYHLHPFIQQNPDFVLKKIEKLQKETNSKKVAKNLQSILDSKRKTSLVRKTSATLKPKKSFWGNRVETIISGRKIIGQKVKTIVQNSPRIAKNILRGSTFASASNPAKKEKTILGTKSPLRDGDLESLRIQTLVSFQANKNTLTWVKIPNEKELLKSRAADFFKILKSISLISSLTREQRQFLTSLKSTLMIRANLLLQEEIIVNIINQGMKSYHHTLSRLANICSNKNINKKIWDYLEVSTEKRIKKHQLIFRQQFERILTSDDLEMLLKKYPLLSTSVVKKYHELIIIKNLHHVYDTFQKYPHKLTNIMNKYLGYGEANTKAKLAQVLLTNTYDMDIFQKIKNEKTIPGFIGKLQILKTNNAYQDTSNKILNLLNSFLQSDNKINFSGFKASLNFLSTPLLKKTENLVRLHITKDLNMEVKNLLGNRNTSLNNLQLLVKVLKNPRYQYADIQIFEMNPLSLSEKISNLQNTSGQLKRNIDYAFPYPQFPKNFRNLLEKSKLEEASLEEKNIANFCRELENITEKVRKRQLVIVKSEIIDLFTSYGNINFSDVSSSDFLNGYAIARTIREYYNNANRREIDLSYKIISEVRDKVKTMIDNERTRQLQKL